MRTIFSAFCLVLLLLPKFPCSAEEVGTQDASAAHPEPAREANIHWAFVPIKPVSVPEAVDSSWSASAIDRFIRADHERRGLASVGQSDPLSLLRRLRFDLTGLPPTIEEIAAIERDSSPKAFTALVDNLLASSDFGVHWGRYWLDVVRYADSFGSTKNFVFTQAWKYRNYVIDSFNADKPFDLFLREQIAGDLLPADEVPDPVEALKGTGFLTLGCRNLNEMDPAIYRAEEVAEQLETFGRAMMGLTLGCARCHDHKTAPIPSQDYYALAGIFYSTEPLSGFGRFPSGVNTRHRNDLLIVLDDTVENAANVARDAAMLRELLEVLNRQVKELSDLRRDIEDADPYDADAVTQLNEAIDAKKSIYEDASQMFMNAHDLAMGVRDAEHCGDVPIQLGGDPGSPDDVVIRAFLPDLAEIVSHDFLASSTPDLPTNESGRLQLARWLTRPDHPLVARVMVNRIWGQLFGRGIVPTVDNLGPSGDFPTHPQLLDFLATEFIKSSYSIKHMIRIIVLSRVYQQATRADARNAEIDPDNVYLWQARPRRLNVESIRDAMLWASGTLEPARPEGSLLSAEFRTVEALLVKMKTETFLEMPYRTAYLPVLRSALPDTFQVFDFAPPEQVCGRRNVTTVAPQALYFMNNSLVIALSTKAAEQLLEKTTDSKERFLHVYLDTVGRSPTEDEIQRMQDYVDKALACGQSELSAWTDLYHGQFGSVEFFYRN